eukprot:ctg_285.g181
MAVEFRQRHGMRHRQLRRPGQGAAAAQPVPVRFRSVLEGGAERSYHVQLVQDEAEHRLCGVADDAGHCIVADQCAPLSAQCGRVARVRAADSLFHGGVRVSVRADPAQVEHQLERAGRRTSTRFEERADRYVHVTRPPAAGSATVSRPGRIAGGAAGGSGGHGAVDAAGEAAGVATAGAVDGIGLETVSAAEQRGGVGPRSVRSGGGIRQQHDSHRGVCAGRHLQHRLLPAAVGVVAGTRRTQRGVPAEGAVHRGEHIQCAARVHRVFGLGRPHHRRADADGVAVGVSARAAPALGGVSEQVLQPARVGRQV